MNREGEYTVKMSDGTTITFDGFKYLHIDKDGTILQVVRKGERPSAKIVEGVQMAIDFLTANYDLSGLHLNPGSFPLAAEELISEEEVKAWHKKQDDFYEGKTKSIWDKWHNW